MEKNLIVWEGASMINGEPIVVILTGLSKRSNNPKTGDMPQVWILRADMHPIEALKSGADVAICGDCKFRPTVLGDQALKRHSRTCYVRTMSFSAVYKAYKAGKYQRSDLSLISDVLAGKCVRIGAYGDPAAVPTHVWDTLLSQCDSTGYTHQWRNCDPKMSRYCMASCDTLADIPLAASKGYRVFYVQPKVVKPIRSVGAIKMAHCPASKELGKVTTCKNCMVCGGNRSSFKSNVTIMLH